MATGLDLRRFTNSVLLGDSAAGVLVSGDSGTGKSNLMYGLMTAVLRTNCGATLLDPHGDLADDIEPFCAALPPSLRRRVVVIRYSDTNHITGLNPLAVTREGVDETTYKARVASRVGHVARILLYAFGERDFNGKPVLAKWVHRFLTTLALVGLTLADVRHFFDFQSPVFQALTAVAPDFVSQFELEQLAGLRPGEREEQVGSAKNRFLNLMQNPLVELSFSKPDGHLDFAQLIQDRAVILVSLARGSVLREEDVEIFANLWLMEILFAIYNTPRHARVPHCIFIDELPVFRASFDIITRALAQVRKFQCRFVCAFQGTQLFEEREKDRLLQALISHCNAHFYFRHKNPIDAKFIGEIIKLPTIDTKKIKHVQTQLQQYQDGNELVTLTDESDSISDAAQDGGSSSNAISDTQSHSEGNTSSAGSTETTSLVANAVSQARSDQSGTSSGTSSSRGSTETSGSSWSKTTTRGKSVTRKQSLVPRIRTREIVTATQFYTTDEQIIEAASELTTLPRGTAMLYIAGQGVTRVNTPLARNPMASTPRFAAKKIAQLRREVHARPEFDTTENLKLKRIEFEQKLVKFLQDAAANNERIAASQSPVLIAPAETDNGIITI